MGPADPRRRRRTISRSISRAPASRTPALHVQAAWQHRASDANVGVRAFGGYTLGRRATDLVAPGVIVVERLQRRPDPRRCSIRASAPIAPGRSARVSTTGGTPAGAHTVPRAASISPAASATAQSTFSGRVGELINGAPARVWDFTDPPRALRLARSRRCRCSSATRSPSRRASRSTAALRFETHHRIGGAAARRAIGWQQPAAARRRPLDDAQFLAALGVRPTTAATDTACRCAISPTAIRPRRPRTIYRWNATTAGAAAAERDRTAGAALRDPAPAASPDSRRSIRR